jgi:mannose-1-phosphate guanylyltransferase
MSSAQHSHEFIQEPGSKVGKIHHWGIILAGGEGARMRPWIARRLRRHRPKQYCTFVGSRSMLQHTLDRTARLVPPDRIITITGCGHGAFIRDGGATRIPGLVIEQPVNRDTAPGVLVPLAFILARDPKATVLVFPSDHFIRPEEVFHQYALKALQLAELYVDRIVLLGAVPDRPEIDFGWIRPGRNLFPSFAPRAEVREVLEFKEKPKENQAVQFLEKNYLWNTLIMGCKGAALWELGHRMLPELMEILEPFRSFLSGRTREAVGERLSELYLEMQPANFSNALLERAVDQALVLEMSGVEWSDWGRPQRVMESLERLNRPLAFSAEAAGDMASLDDSER